MHYHGLYRVQTFVTLVVGSDVDTVQECGMSAYIPLSDSEKELLACRAT